MDEFDKIKQVQITYSEKKRTVNITGLPYTELNGILTAASLYNSLSVRAYQIEHRENPENDGTLTNLRWCEARHRKIQLLCEKQKVAAGEKENPYTIKEADSGNLDQWMELFYPQDAKRKAQKALVKPPIQVINDKPYSHIYQARLLMLELMQCVAYAAGTIVGLSRRNHYNQTDFAIRHLKRIPQIVEEMLQHLHNFDEDYKSPENNENSVQDIEKSFGVM